MHLQDASTGASLCRCQRLVSTTPMSSALPTVTVEYLYLELVLEAVALAQDVKAVLAPPTKLGAPFLHATL